MVAGGTTKRAGTAFFVGVPGTARAAAITTAHGFALEDLLAASEVTFELERSEQLVARSDRLLAPPGRPYQQPGASVRDDLLLFALDEPPSLVRLLVLDERDLPAIGERVQILGIPPAVRHDEDDVFGEIAMASGERIEIELDAPTDLRGWGGSPVLANETRRVVGIVQAAQKRDATLRLIVSPTRSLRAALAAPLAAAGGSPFATFRGARLHSDASAVASAASGESSASQRSAPGSNAPRTRSDSRPPAASHPAPSPGAPATPSSPASKKTAEPLPPPAEATSGAARTAAAGSSGSPAAPVPEAAGSLQQAENEPLLPRQPAAGPTRVELTLDTPADGAVFGDENGAFVAGRAAALRGGVKRFDVVIVLDTSGSTQDPTGSDIDGNGKVGKAPVGAVGALVGLGNTDRGDSILAAEVTAARKLLANLDPRSTRVGLVTFAGDPPGKDGILVPPPAPPARTEEGLTSDYKKIEASLSEVLERGPDGMTHIAAGLDQATIELLELSGSVSSKDPESQKFVLFMTDGQPTLPSPSDRENVRAVRRAIERARRAGIRIHSFAIGPDALERPVAVVEMASRSGGRFTPVRTPADIVELVASVRFAEVDRVEVRNLTTGAAPDASSTTGDGAFSALVPLAPGENRIEVVAHANDGTVGRTVVVVRHDAGQPAPPLPKVLVLERNRLLAQKLIALQRERIAGERAAAESQRKELEIEIQSERAAAKARADEQREQLELDSEDAPQP